jgi:hypothetical protein
MGYYADLEVDKEMCLDDRDYSIIRYRITTKTKKQDLLQALCRYTGIQSKQEMATLIECFLKDKFVPTEKVAMGGDEATLQAKQAYAYNRRKALKRFANRFLEVEK